MCRNPVAKREPDDKWSCNGKKERCQRECNGEAHSKPSIDTSDTLL